jgi:C-terminal processing protease CtpA/Prc
MFPTPANSGLVQVEQHFENHAGSASVHYRSEVREEPLAYGDHIGFPMIVLVNGETSGGAELVAAVLQDNHRALVAGQRTRGKGSIQEPLPLFGQDARNTLHMAARIENTKIKLTTGFLFRPSGKKMNRFANCRPEDDWGVRPDPALEFRISGELNKQLKEWWQLQDLRPGSSAEGLPLDDLLTDPQRDSAVRVLREMLR